MINEKVRQLPSTILCIQDMQGILSVTLIYEYGIVPHHYKNPIK